MEKPKEKEQSVVKKTMLDEGWKYLGTTDMEIWGKNTERILYCPITERIKKQYTEKLVV